jgi:hypothetical protein
MQCSATSRILTKACEKSCSISSQLWYTQVCYCSDRPSLAYIRILKQMDLSIRGAQQ